MAENAHYAHTVSLILHRNNALRQANGLNTRSYLAVSHQSSFSRWDAGIHGRTVAQGTTRQKMVKSVLLFFNAACNKPPGDLRCDDAGARREVDFGASHVMQERKRREKLNERFIILRSLVPFVTKARTQSSAKKIRSCMFANSDVFFAWLSDGQSVDTRGHDRVREAADETHPGP